MQSGQEKGQSWEDLGRQPSMLASDFNIEFRIKLMDVGFVLSSVLLFIFARTFLKYNIRYNSYFNKRKQSSSQSYWNFLGLSQKLQVLLHTNISSKSHETDAADSNFPTLETFKAQYPSYGYDGEIDVIAADFPNHRNEHYLDHAGATLYSLSQVFPPLRNIFLGEPNPLSSPQPRIRAGARVRGAPVEERRRLRQPAQVRKPPCNHP